MRKCVPLFCALGLCFATQFCFAQNKDIKDKDKDKKERDKDEAADLAVKAIKLEGSGKMNEALTVLGSAQRMDPENYRYSYEMAYCYRVQKEYKKGLDVMHKVMAMPGIQEECYQMLGNLYDLAGDSALALQAYAYGIEKFPNSGMLYLETGNVHLINKQYNEALRYYEKGIELAPVYTSNYYRAAQIYTSSTTAVWGMVYGEIFMNLERNTERTETMSKWLSDTYKSRITLRGDSVEVNFCKDNAMAMPQNGTDAKMPFGAAYDLLTAICVAKAKAINMETLCQVRTKFIDLYYEKGYDKTYPNVLFDYEHKMKEKGLLNAYSHWVLMKGDEKAAEKWQDTHKKEWDEFVNWFSDNPLKVTAKNVFLSWKVNG